MVAYVPQVGGAHENRNRTALDHWRLVLDDDDSNKKSVTEGWEELESVPDAGTHGRGFAHEGVIYYMAFCDLDQGVSDKYQMAKCQKDAVKKYKQLLHHTTDAGFVFMYATEFAESKAHHFPNKRRHWERLPDMPFPACHAGSVLLHGRYVLLGGGGTTVQVEGGSSPIPVT
jgi:hypothetical protein